MKDILSSLETEYGFAALDRAGNRMRTGPIAELFNKALADDNYDAVFEEFCNELSNAGLPLLRAHLSVQTLHPLVSSVDLTWLRGQGLEVNRRAYTPTPREAWLQSPLYWMLTNEQQELRQDLRDDDVVRKFAVFEELRKLGATDIPASCQRLLRLCRRRSAGSWRRGLAVHR